MEIPFGQFAGMLAVEPGSMRAPLDWPGLAARLAAAHAARQALASEASHSGTPSGSFAPAWAPAVAAGLAAARAQPAPAAGTVNQIAKANRKHLSLREDATGGDDPVTVRGPS